MVVPRLARGDNTCPMRRPTATDANSTKRLNRSNEAQIPSASLVQPTFSISKRPGTRNTCLTSMNFCSEKTRASATSSTSRYQAHPPCCIFLGIPGDEGGDDAVCCCKLLAIARPLLSRKNSYLKGY